MKGEIRILDVTNVKDRFNVVNAYNLSTVDQMELENKYGVSRHFFKYIKSPSQIPRFVQGDTPDKILFIMDIPLHKEKGTVGLPVVIDDNHNITIFTTEHTKYVVPIISKLLNEKGGDDYGCPCVLLDTCGIISDKFLDRIRLLDERRIQDKKLLRDKSKHRNTAYIAHLSNLRAEASGYATSLASDYSLLISIKDLYSGNLNSTQKKVLNEDLIEYKQAKQEAEFSFSRCRSILRSFSLRVSMSTNHKMSFLSIIAFICSPSSLLWTLFGINTYQKGFPIQTFPVMFFLGIVLDILAWLAWHLWTRND